ncbi:uncharacterized protein LOC142925112 [Petromyzon marinus]|uniref:uncharacterized protein LOC142925112 n=1 Tax=Petromyzon marinus TaxID=7757 RepID=UPI003F6EDE63
MLCCCAIGEFSCGGGQCIPSLYRCDGDADCPDGSDEGRCTDCPPDSFQCGNGACTSPSFVCDGADDCGDYSDEQNCSCAIGEFSCGGGQCIPSLYRCDGDADCPDGSDEGPCTDCPPDSFQCGNGTCTSPSFVLKLTPFFFRTGCAIGEFSCGGGQCIPSLYRCDGDADCPDGSDEARCCPADSFQCDNGACAPLSAVCNGSNDCGDNSDEEFCTTQMTTRPPTRTSGPSTAGITVPSSVSTSSSARPPDAVVSNGTARPDTAATSLTGTQPSNSTLGGMNSTLPGSGGGDATPSTTTNSSTTTTPSTTTNSSTTTTPSTTTNSSTTTTPSATTNSSTTTTPSATTNSSTTTTPSATTNSSTTTTPSTTTNSSTTPSTTTNSSTTTIPSTTTTPSTTTNYSTTTTPITTTNSTTTTTNSSTTTTPSSTSSQSPSTSAGVISTSTPTTPPTTSVKSTGFDRCLPNPCNNNRQCQSNTTLPLCDCGTAFLGEFCEIINYCDQQRCRHNVKCRNNASNYTCVCPIGFRGDLCQEEMKVFESKTKIEEAFDRDLENESSEKFKKMKDTLEKSMNSHLKVELNSDKVRVVVNSFTNGSIVVDSFIVVDNLVNMTMQTVENGLRNILLAVANDTKLPMNVSSVLMSDFDECQNSTRNDCSPFGTCTNTEGSFNCSCLPFYEDVSVNTAGRVCLAPQPPRNVSVSLQSTTELDLSWLYPSSPVDGFNCTRTHTDSGKTVVVWKSLPASELGVKFLGLDPGTTYSFTVHSYRGNLTGDAVQLNATTKPLTAVNVHASKTFSSITVTWDAPSGQFDSFTLSVAPTENTSSTAEGRVFHISNGTGLKQQVLGLVWGRSYTVALFTVSNGVKSSAAFPTNSDNGVLSTESCPSGGFPGVDCRDFNRYEATLRIDRVFDKKLESPTSKEFTALATELKTEMDREMSKRLDSYVGVIVKRFWNGSVNADLNILLSPGNVMSWSIVTEALKNSTKSFNNIFILNVSMTDVNECADKSIYCDANADCINKNGTYSCTCPFPFIDVMPTSPGWQCSALPPPRNVSVSLQTTTELDLSWLYPSSPVDGFNCTRTHTDSGKTVVVWKSLPASELGVKFLGLDPGVTYSFTVHSYRGNLTGDAVQLNATTKPLTAVNVHASKTFSSITVTWDAPSGQFDSFTLSVAPTENTSSTAEGRVFHISNGTGLKQQVLGLVWGRSYTVALFTVSNGVKSSAAFPTNSDNGVLSTESCPSGGFPGVDCRDFNRYEATLRIDRVFDKKLESPKSEEFTALATELKTELDREMSKRLDSYVGVIVKRFWNGSVNADLNILLSPGNVMSWSIVTEALKNSTKSFINIFILNVSMTDMNECENQSIYCDAKADCINMNGTYSCTCPFPFIDVMPTSPGLQCSDLCVGYCSNGGMCEVNNKAPKCSCTSGYSGAKCETEDRYLGKVVGIPVGLSLAAIVLGVLGYLLFTKTRFARKKLNITNPKKTRHATSEVRLTGVYSSLE